jgi:cytochrome b6-f complex iron-sulfur subunit
MSRRSREKPEAKPVSESRRSFVSKLWWGLCGLAVVEYCWIIAEFLRPGKRPAARDLLSATIVAGPVDRFERGSVTAFPEGKFYLTRLDDGGFLALHRECTHLGCTVPWVAKEGQFVCPCHASSYDITGDVTDRPAPRALDLYAVRIENGIVKVDTSRRIKRASFESGQVARA